MKKDLAYKLAKKQLQYDNLRWEYMVLKGGMKTMLKCKCKCKVCKEVIRISLSPV